MSAVAWGGDGSWFATASLDKQVCLWTREGKRTHTWFGVRILDLAPAADGHTLVGVSTARMVWFYDAVTLKKDCAAETAQCMSLAVSSAGPHVLVATSNPAKIHLWDLKAKAVVRSFSGAHISQK